MNAKRVGGFFLALAGTALAGELVVRAFDAAWLIVVGNGPLSFSAFRNLVGLCALFAGFALILWPSDHAAKKQEQLESLVNNMTRLRTRLGSSVTRDARMFGEIASVYYSLDKLGIATPNQIGEAAGIDHYEIALTFIATILPMVRDGHVKDAREQAPAIIAPLGVSATRLNLPLYQRVWPLISAFRPKAT